MGGQTSFISGADVKSSEISRLLTSLLLVYFPDLPKPVLKVTQGWADAFENEIMEFLCEVDTEIPDVTFTWYKDKEELQEDIYSDEPYLNITSVERVHEGGYTCQIQLETTNVKSEFSNTVSVTVYGE